ncbi:hypothetical protein ACMX04_04960 [Bartonella bacilliformis]|uniref:hypothetical protein n=1 Tax=Bartonella bacilliformis TaxID=774 RepID=UPI0039E319F8
MCFIVGALFLLSAIKQSFANMPTILQKTELSNLVSDINNAVRDKNFADIAAHTLNRLYKEVARRLGMTEVSLYNSLLKKLRDQFEDIATGAYHLDETKIDYLQTKNNSFYALIPTTLETKDRILQYKTLAIFDDNKWYLIYGGQKTVQNPVFLEIYPALDGINLPRKTIIKK